MNLFLLTITLSSLVLANSPAAFASDFETGEKALRSMAGCFLVDYSYVETEALKPGYAVDRRVYDVNREQSVKEWITLEPTGEKKMRLQHVLFSTDLSGNLKKGSMLKHQAEDWEFEPAYYYEFEGPGVWNVKKTSDPTGQWVRKITNLDDGLRYQCLSAWKSEKSGSHYAEWSCDNYAPIPGRETRDMGRRDYNTLQRSTRVIVYGSDTQANWLERQDNVKTIHAAATDSAEATRTALAREQGKNWYVRLPESECAAAQEFAEARKPYWQLLRETWDAVFSEQQTFVEITPAQAPPRFVAMLGLESSAIQKDLTDKTIRAEVKGSILDIIKRYRKP